MCGSLRVEATDATLTLDHPNPNISHPVFWHGVRVLAAVELSQVACYHAMPSLILHLLLFLGLLPFLPMSGSWYAHPLTGMLVSFLKFQQYNCCSQLGKSGASLMDGLVFFGWRTFGDGGKMPF